MPVKTTDSYVEFLRRFLFFIVLLAVFILGFGLSARDYITIASDLGMRHQRILEEKAGLDAYRLGQTTQVKIGEVTIGSPESDPFDIPSAILDDRINSLNSEVSVIENQAMNKHLIVRALALGAIGALMSVLVGKLHLLHNKPWDFSDFRHAYTVMAIGSIVSIVVLGLFLTREISVFEIPEKDEQMSPDFWRVTIVCLVSGAFADRLYQAMSQRVEQVVGHRDANGAPHAESNRRKQ